MVGTVSAKTVRATLGAAGALRLDPRALAEAHGVAEALTDVDARFAHTSWLGLWRDMARATGSESVGLDAAESLPWGHFEVIDYLVGTSDDLGTALRRFERYFGLVSTGVAHVLEDHGDSVYLVRRYAPGCFTRMLAPAEFAFANIVLRTRIPLGAHWCPRQVRFAAPAPKSDAAHRRLFGCPVSFDAEESVIVIDRSTLALRMQRPDPGLRAILERHADMLIERLGAEEHPVGRTRSVILEGLRDGDISISRAARRLGMSVRTLQRALRSSGHTFDELVDESRRDLARRYLGDRSLSIQEIAHLLAFGDLRGFYRAFRRWEGSTPAELRKALCGDARGGAARP
ncbi:MAG: AraC family transcriptional regulator [Polyangiaceae bacterium]|nr:AraC family transcriptional regulator [Polyangiaceae bacterium]